MPRIYELIELIEDRAHLNAYFKEFEQTVTKEPEQIGVRSKFSLIYWLLRAKGTRENLSSSNMPLAPIARAQSIGRQLAVRPNHSIPPPTALPPGPPNPGCHGGQ